MWTTINVILFILGASISLYGNKTETGSENYDILIYVFFSGVVIITAILSTIIKYAFWYFG